MDIINSTFIGSYELRKNLTDLLAKLRGKKEEIVVTQNGKPAAMLLSVAKYLEMKQLNAELEDAMRELANKEYLKTLTDAVGEVRQKRRKSARKLFKELDL